MTGRIEKRPVTRWAVLGFRPGEEVGGTRRAAPVAGTGTAGSGDGKLWTESDRMKLSNNPDKIRIALAGGGTLAAVLAGLKVPGWVDAG